MTDGMWPAVSGALVQERLLDVTANNIANASTRGFRGDTMVFREVLGRATRKASQQLRYAGVATVALDRSSGVIESTGRPLDVALADNGFLVVQTPQGERYTRCGELHAGTDLVLRSQDGSPVLGVNHRPIRLPSTSAVDKVRVAEDGSIEVDGATIGKLLTVDFDDPAALEKEGPTLLRATERSGAARTTDAKLVAGALEGSNVSAVKGMVDLVAISRAFDACQRVLDGMREADRRGISNVIAPRP